VAVDSAAFREDAEALAERRARYERQRHRPRLGLAARRGDLAEVGVAELEPEPVVHLAARVHLEAGVALVAIEELREGVVAIGLELGLARARADVAPEIAAPWGAIVRLGQCRHRAPESEQRDGRDDAFVHVASPGKGDAQETRTPPCARAMPFAISVRAQGVVGALRARGGDVFSVSVGKRFVSSSRRKSSAIGSHASWRSQIAFTMASSGMPRRIPHSPQIHPKKSSPTKVAVVFMRVCRADSHVAKMLPTTVATSTLTPATRNAWPQLWNCRNAAKSEPTAMIAGPKYGAVWMMAAATPQSSAYSTPITRNEIQVPRPTSRLATTRTAR